MYANANKYELRMPVKYRDLKEEEMEYDGGFLNFIVGLAATAVGIAVTAAGNAGMIDKNTATIVSAVCTGISIVCTLGTTIAVFGANAAIKAGTTVGVRTITGVVQKNASDTLGYGLATLAGSDAPQYAASVGYTVASW